jgi:hypothetical protein
MGRRNGLPIKRTANFSPLSIVQDFYLRAKSAESIFRASAAVKMRSPIFCVYTQLTLVVVYWRFGRTYRSHLQRSNKGPLIIRPIGWPETSVNNYKDTLRKDKEEQIPHSPVDLLIASGWSPPHLTLSRNVPERVKQGNLPVQLSVLPWQCSSLCIKIIFMTNPNTKVDHINFTYSRNPSTATTYWLRY